MCPSLWMYPGAKRETQENKGKPDQRHAAREVSEKIFR